MKRPRAQLTVTAADRRRYYTLRDQMAETLGIKALYMKAERPEAQPRPWYRIQNAMGDGGEPAVVHLYDEIGYWGVTAADFIQELEGITAPEITLRINSPGGDVYDGIAIYSAVIDHPATVSVKVDALAASAASFIAQAGDEVEMGRNSELMIHDAWGMCVGNAADMREMGLLLDKASDNIASIYAARAGHGGTKTWRQRMEGESWYSAAEAVEVGLADSVAKTEPRRGTSAPPEDRLERHRHANRAEAGPPPVVNSEAEEDDGGQAAATCPECGATVSEDATECPSCGAKLNEAEVEIQDKAEDPWAELDLEALPPIESSKLHLAILDAADEAELGADTTHLRSLVLGEDWGLDGDALIATVIDTIRQHETQVPEPEPAPPTIPSTTIDYSEVADALRRAVT